MAGGNTAFERCTHLGFRHTLERRPITEEHVGIHLSRADAVDQDALGRELRRHRLRQTPTEPDRRRRFVRQERAGDREADPLSRAAAEIRSDCAVETLASAYQSLRHRTSPSRRPGPR